MRELKVGGIIAELRLNDWAKKPTQATHAKAVTLCGTLQTTRVTNAGCSSESVGGKLTKIVTKR